MNESTMLIGNNRKTMTVYAHMLGCVQGFSSLGGTDLSHLTDEETAAQGGHVTCRNSSTEV